MKSSLVRKGFSHALLWSSLAASSFVVSSCTKFDTATDPDTPAKTPMITLNSGSAGIMNVRALGVTGNAGDFELEFFVADSAGKIISNLDPSTISMLAGADTLFTPGALSSFSMPTVGPFSAEVLIDQSNSMKWNDEYLFRAKAAKLFMAGVTALGGDNEAQLSTFFDFSYGGLQSYGPFTSNGVSFWPWLDNLGNTIGPGTPLYDAVWEETDSLSMLGKNSNKILIVLTDGDDNLSLHSLWESIDHAKQSGVRVFAVALKTGLGPGGNSISPEAGSAPYEMAIRTGGSLMYTADPTQLTSYYTALPQVLKGDAKVMKARFHVEIPKATSIAGRTLQGQMMIRTTSGSNILTPYTVTF